jgi:4-phytase/acid phosphatase
MALAVAFVAATCASAEAQTQPQAAAAPQLRSVVIITRHGVRSPTDPAELTPYSARPWPVWEVPPGYLTPHGAEAMTHFGAAYRTLYASQGVLPRSGCPAPESVYVWADTDERTKATARALLDGLAPHCALTALDAGDGNDPLFHALPAIGKADAAISRASLAGSFGSSPESLVAAHEPTFQKLDAILGCAQARCTRVSQVPSAVQTAKSGLASLQGPVDLASTAVEDFILAYADGKPASDVGWGQVDAQTLLQLSQLHVLKSLVSTQLPYNARALASNLLAHVVATVDASATGRSNGKTRVPPAARFVAFVGHDTNLEAIAGALRLRWLLPGYQIDDTPPGGALVFEIYQSSNGPFVRTFYTAQTLDEMRTLSTSAPERAPVFVPGCPALDCPLDAFDRATAAAIDPAFVAPW